MDDSLADLRRASDDLRHAVRRGVAYVRSPDMPEPLALPDVEAHQALLNGMADCMEALAHACDYAQLRAGEAGMSEPQRLYGHLADHLRDPVLEPTVSPTVGRRRRR